MNQMISNLKSVNSFANFATLSQNLHIGGNEPAPVDLGPLVGNFYESTYPYVILRTSPSDTDFFRGHIHDVTAFVSPRSDGKSSL